MFEKLETAPDDPILALGALARADARREKLELGIGVYIDDTGNSPVMGAVRRAEQRILKNQTSKAYLPAQGNAEFLDRLAKRIFSERIWTDRLGTIGAMQSTGCVAALRVGGDVLHRAGVRRIWITDPTWPIHGPIFKSARLEPVSYPYYSLGSGEVSWTEMMAGLEKVAKGDAVLLHGCCHNPSGADLSIEQWEEVAALLKRKGAIPLIDIAYAGLGMGWDEDLAGFRALVRQIDEAVVAVSCSKSFGLYRERTGALFFVARNSEEAAGALSNGLVAARTNYSMPPDHGAATVAEILGDPILEEDWIGELERMRQRIAGLRIVLADMAGEAGLDWDYLRNQLGMFSLLPLSSNQVEQLRSEFAIYMPGNGRICIPGLSESGCHHLIESCVRLSTA